MTNNDKQLQLFPRRIFSVMPFLVRLRSPRSDSLSLSCTSGVPRTHTALCKNQLHKATQPLTYSRTLVCADAVNAEVLLRFARNELLERAQLANRHVTALVDEEYVFACSVRGSIRTKPILSQVAVYHSADQERILQRSGL